MFEATTSSGFQKENDLSIVRSKNENRQERRLLPTLEACAEIQYAYNFFNDVFFRGALPQCILTYTHKKNCLGYFSPDRFERSNGELLAQLALNPHYLALRSDRDSLSTLTHEQVHVWRHYRAAGNGGRPYQTNGYHDRVWADRMEAIGLIPSDTGLPGGKRTGYRMSHYIVEGGPFDIACTELLASGFRINWHERVILYTATPGGDEPIEPDAKKDRIKFTCPSCTLNAWAKPAARLTCTDCRVQMRAASQSQELVHRKTRR